MTRWGISPDDSHYLPVFPFPFFDRLTTEDVADLKAFLDSLPAILRHLRLEAGILQQPFEE